MKMKVLDEKQTEVVVAVLRQIDKELQRCYWNANQKEMESPFDNNGNSYRCDAFSVHAYEWNDDNENNFVYPEHNLVAEWYKYLGRGDFIRVPYYWRMEMLADMLNDCVSAIRKDFKDGDFV